MPWSDWVWKERNRGDAEAIQPYHDADWLPWFAAHRAGVAQEAIELPEGTTLLGALAHLIARYGPGPGRLLIRSEGSASTLRAESPGRRLRWMVAW